MEPYEFIEGCDIVVARFGCWPSFHDGEVHRLVFDRLSKSPVGASIPSIEMSLRGWIMTRDVAANGAFKREADSVVRILFEDVFDVELEGFNHQNVLSSLNLEVSDGEVQSARTLHVELEHCYQFSCAFKARRAKVLSAAPYTGG